MAWFRLPFTRPARRCPAHRRPPCRKAQFEVMRLEDRTTPVAWVENGPGPIMPTVNTFTGIAAPTNRVSGAIESIAVDPVDPRIVYVGAVNGGVWRTNDITAPPDGIAWTPLTDSLPSLAIGSIAFSPADPTGNTLYVGTGNYTNGGGEGGRPVGLYRTTNGGTTWQQLGTNINVSIRKVLPTADPNLILAAAADAQGRGGLFRSVDAGASFQRVRNGLPQQGSVTDVVADPNVPGTFYAALPRRGVFASTNSGQSWTRIDNPRNAPVVAGIPNSRNIELAVSKDGTSTVLYVGVVGRFRTGGGPADRLTGVSRREIGPASGPGPRPTSPWQAIGTAPPINQGGQGFNNFAIVADPINPNVVYVGGDTTPQLFRGDSAAGGGGLWFSIAQDPAVAFTAPHVDARALVFLNNTTLLEADDGGLYGLANPLSPMQGRWVALSGNLRITEAYKAAYDSINDAIFIGTQDNGSPQQSAPGSLTWPELLASGDGNSQAADVTSPGNNRALRFSMSNNFHAFNRLLFDNTNMPRNPIRPVEDASGFGVSPIVITSVGHGLGTGDTVFIDGVGGNTAANGVHRVTVVNANQFVLDGTTGIGDYQGGGVWRRGVPITNVSGNGVSPIEITSPNHGLISGMTVRIAGVQGNTAANGSFVITVVDADHFTLNGTTGNGDYTGGGVWVADESVHLSRAINDPNGSGLRPRDANFDAFDLIPYVLNTVDPRRMLIGYHFLYEDNDPNPANGLAGDVIRQTGPSPRGLITALVYGGRRNGQDEAQIAFAGTRRGQLLFRGVQGGFRNIPFGGLAPIRSIVVDPQDWRRVWVIKGNRVWFTSDVTRRPFRNITTNLGVLTNNTIRSLQLVDTTPDIEGDSTVLVGGLNGVFRKASGPDANWTPVGTGMPNVLVHDLVYNADDNLLIAATFGRGAWTLPDASTSLFT